MRRMGEHGGTARTSSGEWQVWRQQEGGSLEGTCHNSQAPMGSKTVMDIEGNVKRPRQGAGVPSADSC